MSMRVLRYKEWLRIGYFLFGWLLVPLFLYSQSTQPAGTDSAGDTTRVSRHTVVSQLPMLTDTILFDKKNPGRTHHAADFALRQPLPNPAEPQTRQQQKTGASQLAGDPLSLTIQVTNPTCQYGNGVIIASASGGAPPYQFAFEDNDYTNLGAFTTVPEGTYTIHVRMHKGKRQVPGRR